MICFNRVFVCCNSIERREYSTILAVSTEESKVLQYLSSVFKSSLRGADFRHVYGQVLT